LTRRRRYEVEATKDGAEVVMRDFGALPEASRFFHALCAEALGEHPVPPILMRGRAADGCTVRLCRVERRGRTETRTTVAESARGGQCSH